MDTVNLTDDQIVQRVASEVVMSPGRVRQVLEAAQEFVASPEPAQPKIGAEPKAAAEPEAAKTKKKPRKKR